MILISEYANSLIFSAFIFTSHISIKMPNKTSAPNMKCINTPGKQGLGRLQVLVQMNRILVRYYQKVIICTQTHLVRKM